MTRIAPSDRRQASKECPLLDVAWRVGVRGRLTLVVRSAREVRSARGCAGDERVRVEVLIDHGDERLQSASEGSIRLDRLEGGVDAALEFTLPEPHMADCRVTLLFRDGIAPLLLTDLPARLGLRGGTYAVDHLRAEPAAWQAWSEAIED